MSCWRRFAKPAPSRGGHGDSTLLAVADVMIQLVLGLIVLQVQYVPLFGVETQVRPIQVGAGRPAPAATAPLVLSVLRTGYTINGQPALLDQIQRNVANSPNATVVIQHDTGVLAEDVDALVDALSAAGVHQILFRRPSPAPVK